MGKGSVALSPKGAVVVFRSFVEIKPVCGWRAFDINNSRVGLFVWLLGVLWPARCKIGTERRLLFVSKLLAKKKSYQLNRTHARAGGRRLKKGAVTNWGTRGALSNGDAKQWTPS